MLHRNQLQHNNLVDAEPGSPAYASDADRFQTSSLVGGSYELHPPTMPALADKQRRQWTVPS